MNRKILVVSLFSILLLSGIPVVLAVIPRTHQAIIATIVEPESVDPAWAYDTASGELIFNVYDRLINFAVDRTLPPEKQGKTDVFVPSLATEWSVEDIEETSPEGLTWVQRYYFKIRTSVKFHNGAPLTCEDVEYSFERWMVQCRAGGPTWKILEPTLGIYSTRKGMQLIIGVEKLGKMIDHAVESNCTHVWFNLVMSYAPFLYIIAQSWASILDYDWCIGYNDWPGAGIAFADRWGDYTGWVDYNNPEVSPLDITPVMCGTGPYKFDYWEKGVEWSLVRNVEYWAGWPADLPCQGAGYPAGWFERVTEKFIPEWATRKMMFLAGDVDFCAVPKVHIPELWINYPKKPEEYVPGIACFKDLPTLTLDAMFFNYDISRTSPYLGPGFDLLNPYVIAEDRIPINFFSDIHVRKGFAYSFDYDTYIKDVYMGQATRPAGPVKEGEPYYNPAQEKYYFDLALAEAHFKMAWGGEVWEKGFTMGIAYNTRNVARMIACEMIEAAVEGINPKFHIDVYEVPWPTYLKQLVRGELTLFILGWSAEYADPHDNVHAFMHSQGAIASFQSIEYGQSGHMQIVYTVNGVPYGDPTKVINNAYVDEMIENGIKTTIGAERRVIYYELQAIYHDEVPSVPLAQPLGRHWERDWMMGWYYNPLYPPSTEGIYGLYYYHYWKGYYGDCDKDYDVDLDDLYCVLIHYCEPVPPAPPECDFDKDGHIDLDDLYWVLWNYGK